MKVRSKNEVILSHYTRNYEIDEGNYLLLNLFSGAIDLVDKDVLNVIEHVKQFSSLPLEYDEENPIISLLFKRGYFIKSLKEEKRLIETSQNVLKKLYNPDFLLLITYNCNFRCPYCYEQTLRNKPKEFREKVMSEMSVDAAFRFFDIILDKSDNSQENTRRQRQMITLYGGEPFLPSNLNIVETIGSKTKERNWVLSAITNGYHLEEFLPIIKKYDFINFQVTLDGPKQSHDSSRYLQGRKPTFDKIVRGIDQVLVEKQESKIGLRMNISSENIKHVPEFLNFCREKDWMQQNSRVNVMLSSITPSINAKNYCSYTSDIDFLREIYKIFGDSEFFTKILYYYLFLFLPNPGPEGFPKENIGMLPHFHNCGANAKQYILDPFGYIYPCWGVIGESMDAIGKYDLSGHEFYESNLKKWRRGVLDIPECSGCGFAFICAGGCIYKSLTAGKDHSIGHCGQFSEIFEEYVPRHIMVRMKEKGSPWYVEL